MKHYAERCILALVIMSAIVSCAGGEPEDIPTPRPEEGFTVRPGETYPPERDFSADGSRGVEDRPPSDWWAGKPPEEGEEREGFEWDDELSLWARRTVDSDPPKFPSGEDNDGDDVPDCEPTVRIWAENETSTQSCNPYPEDEARLICDGMYNVAAMACKRICDQVPECPEAFPIVPAIYELWWCFDWDSDNDGTVDGGYVTCRGLVECACAPEG